MAISLSTPVTGTAQTGLTSPTYTLASDIAPDINGRQWAVTALGGTQVGVVTHSATNPFTISAFKPKVFRTLGKAHPVTGLISSIPMNTYKVITRKSVLPQAGQPSRPMIVTTMIEVPAGADVADASSVRAALSLHIGALSQVSAGVGDTSVSGLL